MCTQTFIVVPKFNLQGVQTHKPQYEYNHIKHPRGSKLSRHKCNIFELISYRLAWVSLWNLQSGSKILNSQLISFWRFFRHIPPPEFYQRNPLPASLGSSINVCWSSTAWIWLYVAYALPVEISMVRLVLGSSWLSLWPLDQLVLCIFPLLFRPISAYRPTTPL